MKILITGDQGFVGTATKKLIKSTPISDYVMEARVTELVGYDIMHGKDIRNIKQLDQFVVEYKPERILHLAAIARFSEADQDPLRAYETNVVGTVNVAEVAAKHQIPLVFASTGSTYMPIEQEPPITEEFQVRGNSVYGVTKAIAEKAVQEIASPWIILRYAHLYGKEKRHHGLIGGFLERINRGLEPQLYGGQQSNDFTYIKDVARANLLALTAPWDAWNQAYNIGSGEELTAEAAGRIICEQAGYTGEIKQSKSRTVDPQRFVYATVKAETMLGFKAEYRFEAGLKDMFS